MTDMTNGGAGYLDDTGAAMCSGPEWTVRVRAVGELTDVHSSHVLSQRRW